MLLIDIQEKARQMGVNPGLATVTIGTIATVSCLQQQKLNLIRAIQRAEGFESCYATKIFNCDQINCLWRSECQGMVIPFIVR